MNLKLSRWMVVAVGLGIIGSAPSYGQYQAGMAGNDRWGCVTVERQSTSGNMHFTTFANRCNVSGKIYFTVHTPGRTPSGATSGNTTIVSCRSATIDTYDAPIENTFTIRMDKEPTEVGRCGGSAPPSPSAAGSPGVFDLAPKEEATLDARRLLALPAPATGEPRPIGTPDPSSRDVFDINDAAGRLQAANLEIERERLLREATEREKARQAEEARRQAAIRAQQAEREYLAAREREREERARSRANSSALLDGVIGALGAYNSSRGIDIPSGSSTYGGYSSGIPSANNPARAACDRQISAAADRLAGAPRGGGGICASAQAAVRLYTDVERAYAGCQQYYAADYRATVEARRQAEATVRSACVTPSPSGGGFTPTVPNTPKPPDTAPAPGAGEPRVSELKRG